MSKNEKRQADKNSIQDTTKDWATRTPPKSGDEFRCS